MTLPAKPSSRLVRTLSLLAVPAVALQGIGLPHLVERHRWSRFRVDDQSFGIRARHFGRYGCPMTRTENGATINAMERRNSLRLVVIVVISAIAVGLQAADERSEDFTVRILDLPDHGQANIIMDYIHLDPKTASVWLQAI